MAEALSFIGSLQSPRGLVARSKRHEHRSRQEEFSCPFFKRDPHRYSRCGKFHLTKMSYVKQHILRTHRLDTSQGSEQDDLESISAAQESALKQRSDQKLSPTKQWIAVFRLLFPNAKELPSPYPSDSSYIRVNNQDSVTVSRTPSTMSVEGPTPVGAPDMSVTASRVHDSQELERQAWFEKAANKALQIPTGYQKVAVLIIRWQDEVAPEVLRLRDIFESALGYRCSISSSLLSIRKPQLALNHAILNHVLEFDNENTLLIVYYSGSSRLASTTIGEEDQPRLELTPAQGRYSTVNDKPATVDWESATQVLRDEASSDVLAIMDCCVASTARDTPRSEDRAYELLAASTFSSRPRGLSFTSALCDALEELLVQDDTLTVTKLFNRIASKERHALYMADRRSVQIAPMAAKTGLYNTTTEAASLTLRFSLGSDLTKEQIEKLADQLPELCKEAKLPLRRVDWVDYAPHRNEGRTEATPELVEDTDMASYSTNHIDPEEPAMDSSS